jgi:transcription elongation GreA/GreB family factor
MAFKAFVSQAMGMTADVFPSTECTCSADAVGVVVRVADRGGRSVEYELVESSAVAARRRVAVDSRLGRALAGLRRGDYVRLPRDNGRTWRVRVIDISANHPADRA